jgi:hypothetical protein
MVRKAQRQGGSRGITSSSKDPINRLPVHKRNYVKVRAEGGSVIEAAKAAGVSGRMGRKYENHADIQAAYRSLVQKAIPAKRLVNLIKGGCEAKMPIFGPDGKKTGERADWKTRRGYIEMAAKHGGYYEEKTANSPVGIQVVVQHIGQKSGNTQRTIEASTQAD